MEFINKFTSLEESTAEIIKDDFYANYINDLLTKYQNIYSDEVPDSEVDILELKKLYYFFNAVHLYAERNFIFPVHEDYQCHYNVKYKNICYRLGINNGQGTYFFAKKITKKDNETEFVDIEDVINKKDRVDIHVLQDAISSLDNRVDMIIDKGIPEEIIIKILEDKVDKLKKDNLTSQRRHKNSEKK